MFWGDLGQLHWKISPWLHPCPAAWPGMWHLFSFYTVGSLFVQRGETVGSFWSFWDPVDLVSARALTTYFAWKTIPKRCVISTEVACHSEIPLMTPKGCANLDHRNSTQEATLLTGKCPLVKCKIQNITNSSVTTQFSLKFCFPLWPLTYEISKENCRVH